MGSQGDAGQFRTPRHIIDFIIEIVNPQKNETILDPACGTAGFLISSYKHLLKQNTKKNLGDKLSASDRKKIGENLNGYDISPDMVKMSLVNMYLHKFTNPKINEYDTLSSEERWNEYYDVILANPPFFSPKGGITPHNRFGVKSTKAEVLFTDYINEHLKPNGRAGIIVPEGIIFQTGTAYKQLRKRLVETSLQGVISLPAGIFQPYSGVKTSILILDKEKSKKSEDIFFINIQNDGYSLNSNRNEIDKNDLPQAMLDIKVNKNLNKIKKIKLLNSEDISFVSSKYSTELIKKNLQYSKIKISEIADIFSGSRQKGGSLDKGIASIGGGQVGKNGNILNDKMVFISEEHFNSMKKGHLKKGDVLIVKDGATTGKMGFYKGEFPKAAINEHIFVLRTKENFNSYFLYYLLKNENFQKKLKPFIQGIIGGINLKFSNIEIPFLSIETQNQIVEELNGYQKIIDGCRQVIENYNPSIDIDPSWEMVEIGKIGEIISGGTPSSKIEEYWNGDVRWLTLVDLPSNEAISFIKNSKRKITKLGLKKSSAKLIPTKSVIVSTRATIGRVGINEGEVTTNQGFKSIVIDIKKYIPEYIAIQIYLIRSYLKKIATGGTFGEISKSNFEKVKIPIPSIEMQKGIVKNFKEEISIIEQNQKLSEKFEKNIQNKIINIWSS